MEGCQYSTIAIAVPLLESFLCFDYFMYILPSDGCSCFTNQMFLQPFNNWMEGAKEDLVDMFIVHTMAEIQVSCSDSK
jgi:hypothetical protein